MRNERPHIEAGGSPASTDILTPSIYGRVHAHDGTGG
jgi:hypothetical protein